MCPRPVSHPCLSEWESEAPKCCANPTPRQILSGSFTRQRLSSTIGCQDIFLSLHGLLFDEWREKFRKLIKQGEKRERNNKRNTSTPWWDTGISPCYGHSGPRKGGPASTLVLLYWAGRCSFHRNGLKWLLASNCTSLVRPDICHWY